MKKLFYLFIGLTTLLVSCDPLEETYKELDEAATGTEDAQRFAITLSDEDYEFIDNNYGVGGFGNFSNEDEAREYIPFLLDDLFPHLSNGSNVAVTYELYRGGTASAVYDYTRADEYELSQEDYASASTEAGEAGFFNNQVKALNYLPEILNNQVTDAEDGDLLAVSYEYAPINYEDIKGEIIYNEDFETDLSGVTRVSLSGDQEWEQYSSSSGYVAARMSGYSGGNIPNEDWLVTPAIDLSGHPNAELKLNHVLNFLFDGVIGEDIVVNISTDFTGDVTTATWTALELDQWPAGNNYDAVESTVSLEDYEGMTVYVGFFYRSTADFAPQWRLIDITVEEGEAIETITNNVFYEYDDSRMTWEAHDENVYYLSSADYDAMGAPGRFDNFSSSVPADDYLPQLVKNKFPFAQEEESVIIVYKYYSSSCSCVQTRGDLYTFENGEWNKWQSVVFETLQFGKEDGVWVPDNTIEYTLTPGDYSTIVASDIGSQSARDNLGQYGNFNTFSWATEEIYDAIALILNNKFSDMEDGQKYLVHYDTFPGGMKSVKFIKENGEYKVNEE